MPTLMNTMNKLIEFDSDSEDVIDSTSVQSENQRTMEFTYDNHTCNKVATIVREMELIKAYSFVLEMIEYNDPVDIRDLRHFTISTPDTVYKFNNLDAKDDNVYSFNLDMQGAISQKTSINQEDYDLDAKREAELREISFIAKLMILPIVFLYVFTYSFLLRDFINRK